MGVTFVWLSVCVLLLDCCREIKEMTRSTRSLAHGLAPMLAPRGSLIGVACAPGQLASDGSGRNGVYTKHLLKHMDTPGLDVEKMLRRVGNGVINSVNHRHRTGHGAGGEGTHANAPECTLLE